MLGILGCVLGRPVDQEFDYPSEISYPQNFDSDSEFDYQETGADFITGNDYKTGQDFNNGEDFNNGKDFNNGEGFNNGKLNNNSSLSQNVNICININCGNKKNESEHGNDQNNDEEEEYDQQLSSAGIQNQIQTQQLIGSGGQVFQNVFNGGANLYNTHKTQQTEELRVKENYKFLSEQQKLLHGQGVEPTPAPGNNPAKPASQPKQFQVWTDPKTGQLYIKRGGVKGQTSNLHEVVGDKKPFGFRKMNVPPGTTLQDLQKLQKASEETGVKTIVRPKPQQSSDNSQPKPNPSQTNSRAQPKPSRSNRPSDSVLTSTPIKQKPIIKEDLSPIKPKPSSTVSNPTIGRPKPAFSSSSDSGLGSSFGSTPNKNQKPVVPQPGANPTRSSISTDSSYSSVRTQQTTLDSNGQITREALLRHALGIGPDPFKAQKERNLTIKNQTLRQHGINPNNRPGVTSPGIKPGTKPGKSGTKPTKPNSTRRGVRAHQYRNIRFRG